jgi:hypothetical protein
VGTRSVEAGDDDEGRGGARAPRPQRRRISHRAAGIFAGGLGPQAASVACSSSRVIGQPRFLTSKSGRNLSNSREHSIQLLQLALVFCHRIGMPQNYNLPGLKKR